LCSAALSMSPWPRPAVWPSVPADAAARISAKQQVSSCKISPALVSLFVPVRHLLMSIRTSPVRALQSCVGSLKYFCTIIVCQPIDVNEFLWGKI
jgi:hypothetical protein